jgi:3',5'-nucleoside bisphosphate phosphatase
LTADLHTHTTHSDGTTSPAENFAMAAAAGLSAIAITDHDTFEGLEEAHAASLRTGVELIPGVELSTEWQGAGIHILGYWTDPDHPELAAECRRLRTERHRRARVMVERLEAMGIPVSFARVVELAGQAPIGRPHVAAAIVESGAVADMDAAFDELIGEDGPAYEPKHALTPVEGVRLLHEAGGVAVLAHPALSWRREDGGVPLALVDDLVGAGLAGVEAEHAAHAPDAVDRWRRIADQRGLVVTGSSDFHGVRKEAAIGERTTANVVWHSLRERSGATRRMTPW